MFKENDWVWVTKLFFFSGASSTDLMLTLQAMLLSASLFTKGPQAVGFSALSGISSQDTIVFHQDCSQAFPFLCSNHTATGGKLPGYNLHFRIFSAFPCDTVSKQHIIQPHPNLFLKSAMLMQLLLHLSVSILTSCLNTLPWAHFHHILKCHS